MVANREPAVVLTGERHNRRFLVRIRGHAVWLPATLWTALCELLAGRTRTASGFVPLSPVTVYRLRKAINGALDDGGFDSLIETGADREYRICLPDEKTEVEEAFSELRAKHLLTEQDMECLLHSCHAGHVVKSV